MRRPLLLPGADPPATCILLHHVAMSVVHQEISSVDRLRCPDNGQGYFTEFTLRELRICEMRRGIEKERIEKVRESAR